MIRLTSQSVIDSRELRQLSGNAQQYWVLRGRELLRDRHATGSELRAASIGTRNADGALSRELELLARKRIGQFNAKHKK